MNPRIPADYAEVGRWLKNFAVSHGKREDPRVEARIDMEGTREGRSYGLRLTLDGKSEPPTAEAPVELSYAEVGEGRTHFAWCEALAQRIRQAARQLAGQAPPGGRRSA